MTNKPFLFIAIVAGCVLFLASFVFAPVVGLILGTLVAVGGFILQRQLDKPDKFAQQFGQADVLNRLWFPVHDELTVVVNSGGRVTEPASAWTTAPGLSKRETNRNFYSGMQRYVRQREHVASLAAGDLATEDSRQQLVAEQQRLLNMAQELLESVERTLKKIPGVEKVARRPRGARPRPTARRARPTATRPSAGSRAGTRQPAPTPRGAPTQTPTPARAVQPRRPSTRPVATPLRIPDTETKPSAPQPATAPLRTTDSPTWTEPPAIPPAPSQPEPTPPPSPPPLPTPIPSVASVPEVVEDIKPPEPAVTTPAAEPPTPAPTPTLSEPAAAPSEPPADLRLDVASVCEELFNPQIMSYQTNRLFDDRYKDAMVRWKGTARRASTYSYDFNFGDGGGTKAELDVYEVKQQYGSRTVKAFVQLPVEAAGDLGARIGDDIEFEGRLLTCEGSARRLYIADARMLD